MLGRFLTTFLLVTGLLILLAVPVFVVAWRKRRLTTIRSFLASAVGVGVLCGSIAAGSERQVTQCLEAGNADCIDSGAAGLQALMMAIYVIVAWVGAVLIYRD